MPWRITRCRAPIELPQRNCVKYEGNWSLGALGGT
jgi:hypothetical protein